MSLSQVTRNCILHVEYSKDGTVSAAWVQQEMVINDGSADISQSRANVPMVLTADEKTYLDNLMATAITPTPAANADQMWVRIQARRTQAENGGAQVNGKWFHSDTTSRIQQLGLKDSARDQVAAGGAMTDALRVNGTQVQWKTMDGTFVPLTCQLAFDIVAAIKNLDSEAFTVAEQHRQAMLAATDPTTYNFSANWPISYAG